MSMERNEAIQALEVIANQLDELAEQAEHLIYDNFREEMGWCQAYDVLNFGRSKNPYDESFNRLIDRLQEDNQ